MVIGETYNSLTIQALSDQKGKVFAMCHCGNVKEFYHDNIKRGKTKSCGCLLKQVLKKRNDQKLQNIIDMRFGQLTIISVKESVDNRFRKAIALCKCGVEKEYYLQNIVSGKTTSCGCTNRSSASIRFKKYNKIRSKHTIAKGLSQHPLYIIYTGMMRRCYCKYDISYSRYGGKGVMVCEEWKNDFKAFYKWALSNGWETGLQIDKDIKGDGKLYSPETCCFVTRKVNCRNRTTSRFIVYNGVTKTLAEWAELKNIRSQCISQRIARGWSIENALHIPPKNKVHHGKS